jgi:predicted nucleotidyltransferase
MLNYGIDEITKNKIVGILKVLFPEAKIYLYGSRARGDYSEFSDIDLAIDAGANKERLDVEEALAVLDGLRIIYKIDVIDLNYVSDEMRSKILKDGVLWVN